MEFNLATIQSLRAELASLPHNKYWQIPANGANFLYQTVVQNKPQLILEIGTSSGYSAIVMAQALIESHNLEAKLITIESNPTRYEFSQTNFQKAGLQKLVQGVKGHAPEVFNQLNFDAPIDLAFFDGTKSQTTSFFEAIFPLLSPNGIILVDNVLSHKEKMQPFFDFLDQKKHQYQVHDIGAGICQISKSN